MVFTEILMYTKIWGFGWDGEMNYFIFQDLDPMHVYAGIMPCVLNALTP